MKDAQGTSTFYRQIRRVMETAQEASFSIDQLIVGSDANHRRQWADICYQLDVIYETWRGLSVYKNALLEFNDKEVSNSLLKIAKYATDIHDYTIYSFSYMVSKPDRQLRLIYYELMYICDQLEEYLP